MDYSRYTETPFHSLVQNASERIVVLDANGNRLYESPATKKVLGYEPEEMPVTDAFEHIHPEDRKMAQKAFAETLEEPGGQRTAEYRYPHKDGSWRWFEAIATNLLDHPSIGGIVVNSRDITERKRAETLLHQAEARYRALVERMPAVTYLQEIDNPDGATYMSPQIQTLTGYSPAECEDSNLRWRIVHPDDRRWLQSEDERALSPGEFYTTEYRIIHRDGRTVWVRNEAVVIEDGGSHYWQGFMLDITERKHSEGKIAESERRFRHLFEQSVDALLVYDTRGKVIDCNSEACRSLGYSREELLELYVHDFVTEIVSKEEWERETSSGESSTRQWAAREEWGEVHEVNAVHEVHVCKLWRKDGATFPVEVRAGSVDYDGERMVLAAARDITERRSLERRIEHQAWHDPLTGLPNRLLFQKYLERALSRAQQSGEQVAVLFMDLDNLKVVNDSLGHTVGDQLLIKVGQRLQGCLRAEEIACRMSGDEFTVVLESISGEARLEWWPRG